MRLSDLIQNLVYGPLSELGAFGEGNGSISPDKLPQLMVRINSAIEALYTRFPLQVRTLTLETVSGLYHYPLRREFAQTSASDELHKFIKDTPADPFKGDVLMVTSVMDDQMFALPFNDNEDGCHWFKSSYDTLSYDNPKTPETFYVEYRARHERFPLLPEPDDEFEVRIPASLELALMSHVAGHVYGNMDMEGSKVKSMNHLQTYENECMFHEERNTFNQWSADSSRDIRKNGWV